MTKQEIHEWSDKMIEKALDGEDVTDADFTLAGFIRIHKNNEEAIIENLKDSIENGSMTKKSMIEGLEEEW